MALGGAFLNAGAALRYRAAHRRPQDRKSSVIGVPEAVSHSRTPEAQGLRVPQVALSQRALCVSRDLSGNLYLSGITPEDTPALN